MNAFSLIITLLLTSVVRNAKSKDHHFVRRHLQGEDGDTTSGIFDAVQSALAKPLGVNRFVDDGGLARCRRHLDAADEDGNGRLTPDEFSSFVAYQSGGNLSEEPFEDLDILLITAYYATACQQCYRATGDDACCVGDKAYVDLKETDGSVENGGATVDDGGFQVTTEFLCSVVIGAIDDLLEEGYPVTPVATPPPQQQPPIIATPPPSVSPPTISTSKPSSAPRNPPSTRKPTPRPITEPPVTPTPQPTIPASSQQPSSSPTVSPSNQPSEPPSGVPSSAPTVSDETNQVCVNFFYSIQNNRGLTARDIRDEIDNTLKTGLELATKFVTIQVLNSTYSSPGGDTATASSLSLSHRPKVAEGTDTKMTLGYGATQSVIKKLVSHQSSRYASGVEHAMELAMLDIVGTEGSFRFALDKFMSVAHNGGISRRRLIHLPQIGEFYDEQQQQPKTETSTQQQDEAQPQQKIHAYYSDEFPVRITNVVSDPYCPEAANNVDQVKCAIVATEVCVTVEFIGDVAAAEEELLLEQVRTTLLEGLADALQNGEFFAAIPVEHIP